MWKCDAAQNVDTIFINHKGEELPLKLLHRAYVPSWDKHLKCLATEWNGSLYIDTWNTKNKFPAETNSFTFITLAEYFVLCQSVCLFRENLFLHLVILLTWYILFVAITFCYLLSVYCWFAEWIWWIKLNSVSKIRTISLYSMICLLMAEVSTHVTKSSKFLQQAHKYCNLCLYDLTGHILAAEWLG